MGRRAGPGGSLVRSDALGRIERGGERVRARARAR